MLTYNFLIELSSTEQWIPLIAQPVPSPSVGELGQGHPPRGAAVRNSPEMANLLQIGQKRAQISPLFAHSAGNTLVGQQILRGSLHVIPQCIEA